MKLSDYLRSKPPRDAHPRAKRPSRIIVATYDYTDAAGNLLYQVVRYEPKEFIQRKPDGRGGWIYKAVFKDISRVPYRLPNLLAFPDAPIFICEGEKDANRVSALDLSPCATTVAGQKWTAEIAAAFKGRDVYILADNDEPGRESALKAAHMLHGQAASIRIVALPGLPEKGDVSDWLNANSTRGSAALLAECLKHPEWTVFERQDLPTLRSIPLRATTTGSSSKTSSPICRPINISISRRERCGPPCPSTPRSLVLSRTVKRLPQASGSIGTAALCKRLGCRVTR